MKLKLIVVAISAALSAGAYAAAGDSAKSQSQPQGSNPALSQPSDKAGAEQSSSAGATKRSSKSSTGTKSMSDTGDAAHSAQSADTVKQVQQALKDKGIDAGPVDGKFGPLTQKGVKQFQEQQKIQATGQINQETLTALGVSGGASAGASS